MTSISPDERGWYRLKVNIDPAVVQSLRDMGHIAQLSLTDIPLVTVQLAQRLKPLQSIGQLWLWCNVTRRAMRHIVQLPGLKILDVLCIRGPGELGHFQKARSLEVFRANHGLSEQDLLEIATCTSIRQLGIQNAALTPPALQALLALPALHTLDAEATPFDDHMAKSLSQSRTLTSLDVGATRITRRGLGHLVTMHGLKSLDLWANALTEDDLDLLLELPQLEYVSIGNYDRLPSLDPRRVVPLLLRLPALKRVWLDGIAPSIEQRGALQEKLDSVRIT